MQINQQSQVVEVWEYYRHFNEMPQNLQGTVTRSMRRPFENVSFTGQGFPFVKIDLVEERLQELGPNWSSEILSNKIINQETVVVHLRLTIFGISKESFGSATTKGGLTGADFKSAQSDALKKACSYFGMPCSPNSRDVEPQQFHQGARGGQQEGAHGYNSSPRKQYDRQAQYLEQQDYRKQNHQHDQQFQRDKGITHTQQNGDYDRNGLEAIHACYDCGSLVSGKTRDFSERHYGDMILCQNCQKKNSR